MAAFALHALVRPELALLAAGSGVYVVWLAPGVLAAAGTARAYAADYVGFAHHDFRCNFHLARRADTFHRSLCESIQLRRAIRSQRHGVFEARAEKGDPGIGPAPRRRSISFRIRRLRLGHMAMGGQRIRAA